METLDFPFEMMNWNSNKNEWDDLSFTGLQAWGLS